MGISSKGIAEGASMANAPTTPTPSFPLGNNTTPSWTQAAAGLTRRGFDVTGTGDAPTYAYTKSVIEYSSSADMAQVNTLKQELSNVTDLQDAALTPGTVELILGSDFTGLTAKGRIEKPAGAWTAEQTVDFMIERINAGDFYVLCPDNDVPRGLDERRILWAAGDIVENRPPLSRWHPDYAEAFAAFLKDK